VHTSLLVHAFPSLHVVPLGWFDHVLVDTLGTQIWQALVGFVPPGA
jgi:hypothetical protein